MQKDIAVPCNSVQFFAKLSWRKTGKLLALYIANTNKDIRFGFYALSLSRMTSKIRVLYSAVM